MHGPMLQGSVHNSWKLKTSQFLHGQHTHRTYHPLSMFGMLWIGVYDSVFQFLPISSNFAQTLKRSGPTFHRPQSTTWSTLCEGDVLHCVRQMVVTPDTDWPPDPPNTVKLHILVAFYFCQVRDGVEDSNAEIWFFNNKVKQKNINHPEGEKQAGRKAEDWSTVKHQTVKHRKLTWRKTTDQHRTADTRRLYRETNEGNEGDTAGATETRIK